MKTIVILLDTVNRNALSSYGQSYVKTPNIDRIASKSAIFDQHWSASLPCMPARRDLLTGRAAFLEKGWGGIEPFDITLPSLLRESGVFSHMITDHYHYFSTGGENYCQAYSTWDFIRGQESDAWASKVSSPALPAEYYGQMRTQYEKNRDKFVKEEDYPTPRTMQAACQWLEDNVNEDRYMLMVEAFDPHEPFDCPDHYLAMYHDSYKGPHFNWPIYGEVDVPKEAIEHLNKRYAATLTMADYWLGKLLDTMDRLQLWEDTLVIFTTDHGYLLGEHEMLGKNVMPVYRELANIPLMVHLPGGHHAGKRIDALSQTIDLMPTILDFMNIAIPESVRGKSLLGLIAGTEHKIRDVAMYGYHAMAINITDGKQLYMRAPAREDNFPCYSYTAIPTTFRSFMGMNCIEQIQTGSFLGHTPFPVFKIPESQYGVPYTRNTSILQNLLFDIETDPGQKFPIQNEQLEEAMIKKLVQAMKDVEAPLEQYERMGLV